MENILVCSFTSQLTFGRWKLTTAQTKFWRCHLILRDCGSLVVPLYKLNSFIKGFFDDTDHLRLVFLWKNEKLCPLVVYSFILTVINFFLSFSISPDILAPQKLFRIQKSTGQTRVQFPLTRGELAREWSTFRVQEGLGISKIEERRW